MSKLMEVRLHLIMLQQGWGIRCRLGEVGYHGCNGDLPAAILEEAARLEAKAGCMTILPFPRRGIEMSQGGTSRSKRNNIF